MFFAMIRCRLQECIKEKRRLMRGAMQACKIVLEPVSIADSRTVGPLSLKSDPSG